MSSVTMDASARSRSPRAIVPKSDFGVSKPPTESRESVIVISGAADPTGERSRVDVDAKWNAGGGRHRILAGWRDGCRSGATCDVLVSSAGLSQRRALVGRNVVGLVAPDLVLRVILAGVVRVALVVEVPGVDLDDGAADVAGFRVPGDVIADFEFGWHGGEGMHESVVMRKWCVAVVDSSESMEL